MARGNPPPLLDMQESIFDQVTMTIKVLVMSA